MFKNSLRKKLIALVVIAAVPLLALSIVMLGNFSRAQNAYDRIISNMTIANDYNLNFKEELDECIYKLVFDGKPFTKPGENEFIVSSGVDRTNPYNLIDELREDFVILADITTDKDSSIWLQNLLRNIDTLEDRVDDIRSNLIEGGRYNENIEMLDNNIYILTELINDDIQYYLYYQTKSIEHLSRDLSARILSFRTFTGFLLLLLISAVIIITYAILQNISRPLSELTRVTQRISDGDFSARTSVYSGDEIGRVAGSVNDMASHLEVMVGQIKEDERKMRNAELRLLQEQINPHFLYNTLDTIVWLIEGHKDDEAEDMIMSLSDFFKLALSHGREFISIRDEELHIRSYLQIQQVRYADILDYRIDIDPAIYGYRILKLTLQPLVENAIYHGIKPKRARGCITIRGQMKEDQIILLSVEDDGAGMNSAQLEALRERVRLPASDESNDSFGMANVNERIRLNFGPEYGMTIDAAEGGGTRVTIRIPAQWYRSDDTAEGNA